MMAATNRNRIKRLERELEFKFWIRHERWFDSLSADELKTYAETGQYPERPEPAPGISPIDNMEREELRKLWKEEKQTWSGRNREEMTFFGVHGHWPERACSTECMNTQER
jgi:hypothetical protein